MAFSEQLEKLGACKEAIEFVGGRTLEGAWKWCKKPRWLAWLVGRVCNPEEIRSCLEASVTYATNYANYAARCAYSHPDATAAVDAATAARNGINYAVIPSCGPYASASLAVDVIHYVVVAVRHATNAIESFNLPAESKIDEVIKENSPPLEILERRIEEAINEV